MTYEAYAIVITLISVGLAIILYDSIRRIDAQNEEIERLIRLIKFKGLDK